MNRAAEAATNTSTQAVLQRALPAALEAHGRGELDAAWTWLDEASRVAPNHPDVLHLRGLVALGRGQPSAAVAWIERAAGASPRTALYWNNLGVAWRAAGDLTRAAAAHRQAIALKPGYASAHNKVLLIDAESPGGVVITGSYNFTWSAQARNAENLLILRGNPALARQYLENWRRHRDDAEKYDGAQ